MTVFLTILKNIPGAQFFPHDRPCTKLPCLELTGSEQIWLKVTCYSSTKFVRIAYRLSNDEWFFYRIFRLSGYRPIPIVINCLYETTHLLRLLCLGDFNVHTSDWLFYVELQRYTSKLYWIYFVHFCWAHISQKSDPTKASFRKYFTFFFNLKL